MMEVNLLDLYPKTKRNPDERAETINDEDKRIAKQFGKEFFDGSRNTGYGGYRYDGRWVPVVERFAQHYGLTAGSSVLDVGCAKGFMLHDFQKAVPGITVEGIDISQYAIDNAMEGVKPFLHVGNAKDLSSYGDKSFTLVVSITTVHNLRLADCKMALREIQRVGKHAFITVDAWRNPEEEARMKKWNITAETFMHVDDWKRLFDEVGYTGDYYWFIP
ncbi:class I SAM-dependent methyltransferase [Candidatus Woesearchaeota archaeon]|nr:class I SAM-dependent methyltransferase [Candidatus Woesearchaeota archaeon]